MPQPLVSLILAVRNEAVFILRTLDALAAQTYPHDRMQVLVADGRSEDGTLAQIAAFAAAHPDLSLQVLDNSERSKPYGFNLALSHARGDVIVAVDGHCVLAPDYIQRCIDALAATGADCAGGAIRTVGETPQARAIALAQSSPFGVGGAAFRMQDPKGGYVDTLAFGAYLRSVFDRIGPLDEELVRNQDDEFNFRLIQAGGRIWLDPAIRSTYYSRATLRKLWKQYYDYGLYKVRVIQKRGAVASWRHLAPATLVLAVLLGLVLFFVTRRKLFLAPVVAYTVMNLAYSLTLGFDAARENRDLPRVAVAYLPFAFAALHFAYGLGFLAGLWRWRHYGLPSLRVQGAAPTSSGTTS